MNERLTFGGRFLKVIVPTRVQVLLCIFGALVIIACLEGASILLRFGVSSSDLKASQDQLADHFNTLSHSVLASNLALVAFWSVVGLVAYLVCWVGYNFLVEARNEVTLETQYENLGSHRGPWISVGIKLASGLALIVAVMTFHSTLDLAVNLFAPVIEEPLVGTVLGAIAGVAVLAFQIYLVLVCLELTFSAWYRPEAFTD